MPYKDEQPELFNPVTSNTDFVEDEERVGYKRPPKRTRYRKGQSGNPKGRPKGSLNKSTLRKMVDEQWLEGTIKIVERGRARHVPRFVALLMKQGEFALKGDLRAMKDVVELIMRLAVDDSTLRVNEETVAEDEAILRNHWPDVLDANEPDSGVSN